MTNQIDILDLNDAINEAFYCESDDDFDLVQDDYDITTEATAKGVTKQIFAVIMDVCRRIIHAITKWIKNRSINKLVALLKKIATLTDQSQARALLRIFRKAKITGTKNGEVGAGITTEGNYINVLIFMLNFKSADSFVKLNAILRQIKATPVEKWNKELTDAKSKIGNNRIRGASKTGTGVYVEPGTIISSIGKDYPLVYGFGLLFNYIKKIPNLSGTKLPDRINFIVPLTKAHCENIGKTLKVFMEILAQFTMKTLRFYQQKEDQWAMTKSQKAVITILKDMQSYVYDCINVTNILITDIKKDDLNEREDIDNESVSIDSIMYDMYNISTALESEVGNMPDADDFEI